MIELASIIILGILAQWLAWRFKVPAILPLILVGLAVGPFSTYYTADHTKWLNPIYDATGGLFPGDNLFYFVELAIGIILFEGGLTLKRNEIKVIGPIILKLISIGSLVTFIGAAIISHFIIGLTWNLSFLFSGLIIVTGPTVIAPILRNIPLKKDVANILKWEGILIDPIGALVAVLVYEFIASLVAPHHAGGHGGDASFTVEAFKHFLTLALVGFSLGTISAYTFKEIIKREWVPHYLLNVFTLAMVLLVFVGSGELVPDSGLLTIVVMGTVLANIEMPKIDEIQYFKESLAVLLISMLFILLSANINISDLELLLNWQSLVLFLAIILVIRPAGVFLSTRKSSLELNEKLFISWVGPRGIVAAGIASLFGNKLMEFNKTALLEGTGIPFPGAELITPLVFMIVLGTVLLNATTAGLVAKLLKVRITTSDGILFIGANRAARIIAKYLADNGRRVILLDSNKYNIDKANEQGTMGIQTDIYIDDLKDNTELNDMGYLYAFTGSNAVNEYAISKYKEQFGENGYYKLVNEDEVDQLTAESKNHVFSHVDDYIRISEVAREYEFMHEQPVKDRAVLDKYLQQLNNQMSSIPLFLKMDSTIEVITDLDPGMLIGDGAMLVYMGKEVSFDEL